MLLTIIQANNTYQTTTHLTSLLSLVWSNQRLQQFLVCEDPTGEVIDNNKSPAVVVDGRKGKERIWEGRGFSVSQAALFSGGCTLDFLSLLCSHSGTGSLTAAVTELDGFDLLWLENTFYASDPHTDDTRCTHMYICTDNMAPCSHRYLHYMQMLNTMTHFTFIYVHAEHTFHNHICLTHSCF